jgi:hypothetical protein
VIVGNGLIAKAFKCSKLNLDHCTIFASGVSSSSVEDKNEFKREFDLISEYVNAPNKFIYFSSIHLLDPSTKNSKYVQHKINIERFIEKNFSEYMIYRLPIVAGKGGNINSLFNYLFRSIVDNSHMNINSNSYRYILDVDDLVCIVKQTISEKNKAIDLVFNDAYSILEIIKTFEKHLKLEAVYSCIDKGEWFEIKSNLKGDSLKNCGIDTLSKQEYIDKTIVRHYL